MMKSWLGLYHPGFATVMIDILGWMFFLFVCDPKQGTVYYSTICIEFEAKAELGRHFSLKVR